MPPRDKERERAYNRLWYERNKEQKRQYRIDNKERLNAQQREWYKKNREKHIAQVTARKWNEYAGTCVVCGKPTMAQSKSGPKPRFCKDHRKEQWEEKTGKKIFPSVAVKQTPKHSEEQRRIWREAQARYRLKLKGEAIPDGLKTTRRSSLEKNQAGLAVSTRQTPSFSHLTRNADRDQDETNGSPPPRRRWASE